MSNPKVRWNGHRAPKIPRHLEVSNGMRSEGVGSTLLAVKSFSAFHAMMSQQKKRHQQLKGGKQRQLQSPHLNIAATEWWALVCLVYCGVIVICIHMSHVGKPKLQRFVLQCLWCKSHFVVPDCSAKRTEDHRDIRAFQYWAPRHWCDGVWISFDHATWISVTSLI